MAKLPSVRRLRVEDYPGADGNLLKLVGNLNQFMDSVYLALSRNLTVDENIKAAWQTLTAQDANYPINLTPKIANPQGIFVAQCLEVDSRGTPTGGTLGSGVTLDWSLNGASVRINKITGLTASKTYSMRLLLVA